MNKLKSLSIFFPFYNDGGTVEKAISDAYKYGKELTNDLEVIAIHGGKSADNTMAKILQQKKKHPNLIVIDKTNNKESYAVIKYGFYKASKEWVFYTDGDLQYYLEDLLKLVREQLKTGADIVNGYKIRRKDNIMRIVSGEIYKKFAKWIFKLPIEDLTCDFRLIRRSFLNDIEFEAKYASILPELIKKLQFAGATFAEVEVKHRKRIYGESTYNILRLLKERVIGDFKIWLKLLYNKNL